MTTVYVDQEYVYPESPWLQGDITARALTEQPAPVSYIQKDGWITAVITGGALNERPVATSYMYAPSNDWLLTDNIIASATFEQPAPTEYETAL
ncbi:hypothetical protein D3C75_552210 [compost metagenome]